MTTWKHCPSCGSYRFSWKKDNGKEIWACQDCPSQSSFDRGTDSPSGPASRPAGARPGNGNTSGRSSRYGGITAKEAADGVRTWLKLLAEEMKRGWY